MTPNAIAIVGISFKMPQGIESEDSLWEALQQRKNTMTKWPESRLSIATFHDTDPDRTDKLNPLGAHFLGDDAKAFDAAFFSTTAKEAAATDPEQRLAMETSYRAFENAGMPFEKIRGSRTAVVGTTSSNDFARIIAKDPDRAPRNTFLGTSTCLAPNRISWFFDLTGPSTHVQTACASSMVALDTACQYINCRDASMALVVGSNLMLGPEEAVQLSNLNVLSEDSLSYVFDHRANGYSRGEGVVAMVLKPVADAVRDGDPIRAVIQCTGTNHNGKSSNIAHPSADLQQALIRHVYRKANLSLDDTCYVEAHGTGTTVGDRTEMTSISNVFGPTRSPEKPLFVGSLKANFGHLEGCSGLASVVKAVLILEKAAIPPQALFEKYHPDVDAVRQNTVPTRCIKLPDRGLRRVSVNSFGVGGTSGHIILDDAHSYLESHATATALATSMLLNGNKDPDPVLLVWSAVQEISLNRMVESYAAWSRERSHQSEQELMKLAHTLGERRSKMLWRTFAVESGGLPTTEFQSAKPARSQSDPIAAVVFTGQGAQYANMGIDLLRYPDFRTTLTKADEAFSRLGCEWSIFDKIRDSKAIDLPEYSQPLTTALQISLYDLLRSFGIVPAAAVGHSSGEIAAAYAIGALSLESACKVAYYRGRVAARVKAKPELQSGAMISVNMSPSEASHFLEKHDMSPASSTPVTIACLNSPLNSTLSGDETAIDKVKALLDADGIFARKLTTGVAYHSPAMNIVSTEYAALMQPLDPAAEHSTSTVMISTVTGKEIQPSAVSCPEYWVSNLVRPVQLNQAVSSLVTQVIPDVSDIIEIGPHHALSRPLREILGQLPSRKKEVRCLHILNRFQPPLHGVLSLAGQLYCAGYPLSVSRANAGVIKPQDTITLADCPAYPFNHSKEYWYESRMSRDYRLRDQVSGALIGQRASDWNPLEPSWRQIVDSDVLPWLEDFSDSSTIRFPSAALLIMALEAVRQTSATNRSIAGYQVKNAFFMGSIDFDASRDDSELVTRLYTDKDPGWLEVKIFAYTTSQWTERFRSHLRVQYQDEFDSTAQLDNTQLVVDHQLGTSTESLGLQPNGHGSRHGELRVYDDLSGNASATGNRVRVFSRMEKSSTEHQISTVVHPAVLDAAFRIMETADRSENPQSSLLLTPTALLDGWFCASGWQQPDTLSLQYLAKVREQKQSRTISGEVAVLSDTSSPLCMIQELRMSLKEDEQCPKHCFEEHSLHGLEWRPYISLLSPAQLYQACHAKYRPVDETELVSQFNIINWIMDQVLRITLSNMSPHELDRASASFGLYLKWAKNHIDHSSPQDFTKHLEDSKNYSHQSLSMTDIEPYMSMIDETCPHWAIYTAIARNLKPILLGEVAPLDLAFGDEGHAAKFYPWYFKSLSDQRLEALLHLIVHEKRELKILELGAGTGGWTRLLLSFLRQLEHQTGIRAFAEFVFTDISPSFFESARAEFSEFSDRMSFRVLDLERDPRDQGFEAGSYDLVLAACVIHAASDMNAAVTNIRRLLRTGGRVMTIEITRPGKLFCNFAFGTIPGWSGAIEDWRALSPVIDETTWDKVWRDNGFSGNDVTIRDYEDDTCQTLSLLCSTAMAQDQELETNNFLLVVDGLSQDQVDLARTLSDDFLTGAGHTCSILSLDAVDLDHLIEADTVIFLLEWDKTVLESPSSAEFLRIRDLIKSSVRLVWVSAGDITNPRYASQGLVQGLFRCVQAEAVEKETIAIAFESQQMDSKAAADQISRVVERFILEPSAEDHFIFRNGMITTGRLVEELDLTSALRGIAFPHMKVEPFLAGCPVKLSNQVPERPNLPCFVQDDDDDNHLLSSTEVTVEAITWSLNRNESSFKELGHGFACAGFIGATGSATGFQIGDRVCISSPGCIRSRPKVDAKSVCKLPDSLTMEAATSAVYPGITALHCLQNVARLEKGETVLIASDLDGAGQAAIQIAELIGAHVFVAIRSEIQKKMLMSEFSIPATQILHHGTGLGFERRIKRMTSGRGIDVVFNTLQGTESQYASLGFLSQCGRFIELKGAGATTNAAVLANAAANASYSIVDMFQIAKSNANLLSEMVKSIIDLIAQGTILSPRRVLSYNVSDVKGALEFLQDGRRDTMAEVVLASTHSSTVEKFTPQLPSWAFDPQSSYIIPGGLGGLGRAIMRWMVSRGARYLIAPSRSGAVSEAAVTLVADLKAQGAVIETPICDVASKDSLSTMLKDFEKTLPPIKGCINAAMALHEAIFDDMTHGQWTQTLASKVSTSWNLHELLPADLDFFILLSSVLGTIGGIGHSNYSAGCAYQDALARHRLSQSPPQKAVSVNVGWIRNVGTAADNKIIASQLKATAPLWQMEDFELIALLEVLCDPLRAPAQSIDKSQVLVGMKTPADVAATVGLKAPSPSLSDMPQFLTKPMFSGFHEAPGQSSADEEDQAAVTEDASQLFKEASSSADKAEVVVNAFMRKVSNALAIVRDDVDPGKPLSNYGVDSLLSVELRKWLARDFGAKLEVVDMMGGERSITDIGQLVVEQCA